MLSAGGSFAGQWRALQPALLEALGRAAVAAVQDAMLTRYPQPVWETGALYHSVTHHVEGDRVVIHTDLPYAALVHQGTARMPARPYMTDGIRALFESGGAVAALRDVLP